jgi:hypothetical protein
MTITDTNSNVLLSGDINKGGNGSNTFHFYIDENNIYNGLKEINLIFNDCKDARVDKRPSTET